jgi:hypothetical protein
VEVSRCAPSMPSTPGGYPSLLIGGTKTGNDRFYEEYVPIADRLYDDHLSDLRQEGIIP